jgi:hypothetical protein
MTALARLALGAVLVLGAVPGAAQVQLQAGAAVAQLVLPEGVPLAGYSGRRAPLPDVLGQHPYAHYFPPCAGGRDGCARRWTSTAARGACRRRPGR